MPKAIDPEKAPWKSLKKPAGEKVPWYGAKKSIKDEDNYRKAYLDEEAEDDFDADDRDEEYDEDAEISELEQEKLLKEAVSHKFNPKQRVVTAKDIEEDADDAEELAKKLENWHVL